MCHLLVAVSERPAASLERRTVYTPVARLVLETIGFVTRQLHATEEMDEAYLEALLKIFFKGVES